MAKGKGRYSAEQKIWALLRLGLGWIFLWAFLDKLFGLGFSTEAGKSWLAGESPTFGFLSFATKGPLQGIYQAMAGNIAVDFLFMGGLLFLGAALILGIASRLAGYIGALMMALIFAAGFVPPEHNPLIDEHIIYLILLIGIAKVRPGRWFGLGSWWSETGLVKKFPVLK
jgi:thiosulfate dehydrogenase [quinone] large subunit